MTQLSFHTQSPNERTTEPFAGWLLPSTLVIGGVLAAALIGAAFMSPQSGSIGKSMGPSIGTIIGASAAPATRESAAAIRMTGQKSFAFGFLEFDWDPNAPGGVPGFDTKPHGVGPAVAAAAIAPADVPGTDVRWSPLTGDGSN